MVRKVINSFGDINYYNEKNKYHREDGPAIECFSGDKFWYINGLCHRTDGPAAEWVNGYKDYFIMDKHYSYENWLVIKDFPLLW